MRYKNLALIFIVLLAGLSFISASIPQAISVHGKLTDSSGNALSGSYNMVFSIYNTFSGGSALYQSPQTVTVNSDGTYDVVLNSVNLVFNQSYYLGIKVGNDNEMTPRLNLTSSPYSLNSQNVSISGINPDSNLDMSNYNLTANYGFFSFVGSILSPIINLFATNINATGNVSAAYLFGNGSQLTGIPGGSNPTFANVNISNLFTLIPQTAPTGQNNGSLFYNSSLNAPMFYNGSSWIGLTGGIGSSIIASGSNVNGSYIEFADGTMIETTPISAQITTSSSQSNVFGTTAGSMDFNTYSWTYPVPFISTPAVTTPSAYDTTSPPSGYVSAEDQGTTASSTAIVLYSTVNNLYNISSVAVGRWTSLNLGTGSGGTGGIVNTITNANGTCTEYSNGIMDCFGSWVTPSYTAGSINFPIIVTPASFSNTNYAPTAGLGSGSAGGGQTVTAGIGLTLGTNDFAVTVQAHSGVAQVYTIYWNAIGQWTNSTNINTPDVSTWGLNSAGNIQAVNSSRQLNLSSTNTTYYAPNASEPSLGTLHMRTAPSSWDALNNGSATTFTDVDLSSFIPSGATGAYLLLNLNLVSTGAVQTNAGLNVRPKGSSLGDGAVPNTVVSFYATSAGQIITSREVVSVGVDANRKIQYANSVYTSGTPSAYITVLGYYA